MTLTEKQAIWHGSTGRAGTGQTGAGRTLRHRKISFHRPVAVLSCRRLSRDVAQDIGWLLNQGRLLGVRAKLPTNGLCLAPRSGELTEQNDMFRLTYAGNSERHGLNYRTSDREWAGRYALVSIPE